MPYLRPGTATAAGDICIRNILTAKYTVGVAARGPRDPLAALS